MEKEDLLEEHIVYLSDEKSSDDSNTKDDTSNVEDRPESNIEEEDENKEEEDENKEEKFLNILSDFLNDIKTTYPELSNKIDMLEVDKSEVFNYCKVVYPERFFDILYQNDEIFDTESKVNTYFLPNIDFKYMWNQEDVSEKTKNIMWKYLQLILFNIVGTLENKNVFGDAADMFEKINKSDFKDKLEETISQMGDMFKDMKTEDNNIDENDLPDTEKIHDHISGIMDGKLGQLAHEIAEETAKELNIEDKDNPEEVFKNLLQDPSKLMGLVKNVGSKLDSKMKSGNLSESELLSEATDIMGKMNSMPGMKNIQDLFKNLDMPKNSKVNKSALNNHMRRNNAKSNLKKKLNKKSKEKENSIDMSKTELDEATRRSDKMMNELLEDLMREERQNKKGKCKKK